MSYDYNRIELIGHTGKDFHFSEESKKPFAAFSLATNRKYRSGDTQVNQTEWHQLVCYGELAELVEKYVQPGSHLFITGELRYEKWEKDGAKHCSAKVFIRELRILDKRQEDNRHENVPSSSESSSRETYPRRRSRHQDRY